MKPCLGVVMQEFGLASFLRRIFSRSLATGFCFFLLIGIIFFQNFFFYVSYLVGSTAISDGDLPFITSSLPITAHTIILIFIGLFFFIDAGVQFFYDRSRFDWCYIRKSVLSIFLCVVFFIGFFQILAQMYLLRSRILSRQPYAALQTIVDEIHTVKSRHPYCQSWSFQTGLNMETDPGMFYHRMWRYFLLPSDMELTTCGRVDCIIFYDDRDYENTVPDDFLIIDRLSDAKAVAVRKDLRK